MRSVIVLACVLAAAPVFAQGRLLTAESRASQVTDDCRRFITAKPGVLESVETAAPLLKCFETASGRYKAIADDLAKVQNGQPATVHLPVVNNTGTPVSTEQPIARLDPYLVREHLNLKGMETWVRALNTFASTNDSVLAVSAVAERVRAELDELLSQRGLRELFSAALVTGAVVGNGETVNEENGGEQTASGLAHIVWESKHFGDDRFEHWDFAFGGKFGFIPALTLVKEEEEAGSEETDAEAVYQEAFVWDFGARANFRLSGQNAAEISIGARIGQTVLGTQSVLLDRGPDSVLAVPVNGTSSAELFYEVGVDYWLHNNPLEVVHGEGSTVSPTFRLGVAWRQDNRFRANGDLAAFDTPTRRLVFRFMIDALKVVDRRQLAEKPRVFTFGFGVEHEAALKSEEPTVPSGTKLIFRGDIDLLRALHGR